MKVRSHRTHITGASNRDKTLPTNNKSTILERSFNKSMTLQTACSKAQAVMNESSDLTKSVSKMNGSKTDNSLNAKKLFSFQKVEVETNSRFDPDHFQKNELNLIQESVTPKKEPLNYGHLKNQKIQRIKEKFKGKNISTRKLYLFKEAILKNNRQRDNFKDYFNRLSKGSTQRVDLSGLQTFVKEYGYDLNTEELKLLIDLNNSHNQKNDQKKVEEEGMDIKDFINLCTKPNVYFKTIELERPHEESFKFIPRHFQILRNKFPKIKEAFKIYQLRGEAVDYQRYVKTMKKLDITDLIMPKYERDELFDRFSDDRGIFNPNRLLSSIAIQYEDHKQSQIEKTGFESNLLYLEEKNNDPQIQNSNCFNLKKVSSAEYESHQKKIFPIIRKLRQFEKKQKGVDIVGRLTNDKAVVDRKQLRKSIEEYLQGKGVNYTAQKYDSLMGYLEFDKDNQITAEKIGKIIFQENSHDIINRIDRQIRMLPPISGSESKKNSQTLNKFYDEQAALKTLNSLKEKTIHSASSQVFKKMDLDRDGYVSRKQLRQQIQKLLINSHENPESIQNLETFLFSGDSSKEYLTHKEFKDKFCQNQVFRDGFRSKSVSEWTNLRKSGIQNFKQTQQDVKFSPTKFSAWPNYLHKVDFSLMQPQSKSGLFVSEKQRFDSSSKHSFGMQHKLQKSRIQQNKIAKMAMRNYQKQEQQRQQMEAEDRRQRQKNFGVRLAQQKYLQKLLERQLA